MTWLVALNFRLQAGKPGWWVALLFALGNVLFLMTGRFAEGALLV